MKEVDNTDSIDLGGDAKQSRVVIRARYIFPAKSKHRIVSVNVKIDGVNCFEGEQHHRGHRPDF